MPSLFDPLSVGELTLSNRILMAPLTRMRSQQPGNIPTELNATYYSQRASAGLIISEATQISQQGQGYPATPGIHSPEQVAGWQAVTKAVHHHQGKIILQLWHVGRISHSSHQPNGQLPVSPSNGTPAGMVFTAQWKQVPYEAPHVLTLAEIDAIRQDYKVACQHAQLAGFDGVEVHGANGYLLDQFLQDGVNHRQDEYGGSIENRARLLLEVVDQAIAIWGKGRVGVRLSPYGTFNDISDSNPIDLFQYVLSQLSHRQIAYVHVIEPRATLAGGADQLAPNAPSATNLFRAHFTGTWISAGGYTPESAEMAVSTQQADAIAFGRWFISNPDLPHRIKVGASLTPYHRPTFYGGSEKGYTDYPILSQSA